MNKWMNIMVITLVLTLTLIGFSSCGDAGGEAKTVAPVMIVVTGVEGGSTLGGDDYNFASDVCSDPAGTGSCTFYEDLVTISVEIMPLNMDDDFEPSDYMSVMITGYEVKYERNDTGYDVPKIFTGATTIYCAVNEETEVPVTICKADMKTMIPLSYLWQFGYEPETGLDIIHTVCTVTLWGKTLAGREVVSNPIRFNVNFANWAG
ncbi:hypothetical protein JW979_10905 [bacterium]|nr:hypothetical protein [candidate division CSSED10-310 bacterium]